ncbi:RHS repeat protein, partial [Streptomyces sp. SID3343]|nr:RHS repeat protein [Streptomyces sp. SID3343]
VKNTYTYDTLGRLTNARETDSANTQLAAWLYCHDKAGNLTATSTTTTTCGSAGTTYTYNAANQTTNSGWSFDANGNETAAPGGLPRTGETYNDFNQLTAITRGSTTSAATYTGTTNAERLTFGATDFYHGSEGLTATVTNGVSSANPRAASQP